MKSVILFCFLGRNIIVLEIHLFNEPTQIALRHIEENYVEYIVCECILNQISVLPTSF